MLAIDERRRLDDQQEAVDAGMTERRERCTSRPTGTCSREDRQECDYINCLIRDIENIDDLHAAIQQDDRDAILHGRPQSRANQIDSNSAIMAERRQRCRSIPPGFCAGASREGCDYCRIRDIIATRNIQHVGAEMTPAELQTIIQHAASELSDQIDAINANMLERLRRCTTMPTGSCAGEQRKECDFCKINDIIAAIRENREVVQLPPVEMLAVIQRDNYERSWRRNHAATTAAMQTISL
jgi:hypothetical protein